SLSHIERGRVRGPPRGVRSRSKPSAGKKLGTKTNQKKGETTPTWPANPVPGGGAGGARGEDNATTHSNDNKPGPAARRGELRGREGRTAAGTTGWGLRQGDQPHGLAGR